jgi:hypothetical protein
MKCIHIQGAQKNFKFKNTLKFKKRQNGQKFSQTQPLAMNAK